MADTLETLIRQKEQNARSNKEKERAQAEYNLDNLIRQLTEPQPPISPAQDEKEFDVIKEFIQSIDTKKDTPDELGKLIQELQKGQKTQHLPQKPRHPQISPSQKLQTAPKTIHSIKSTVTSVSGISNTIKQRFLRAYENYKKLEPGLRNSIRSLAGKFHMNHLHVLSVFANESNFEMLALSGKGAQGLSQLMPTTLKGSRNFIISGSTKNAGPEERFMAALRKDRDFMRILQNGGHYENIAIGIAYLA